MVEAWRLRVCYCIVLAVQMQSVVFARGHTMDQKLQSALDTLWHHREMWSQQRRRRRRRRVVLTKQACVVRRRAGPARFRHKIRPHIPPTCLPRMAGTILPPPDTGKITYLACRVARIVYWDAI